MKNDVFKIATLVVIFLLIIGFLVLRSRPLEKYRERNEMGKEVITIDVCIDQGTDTKMTARKLDDFWQKMRDIYTRMSNFIDDSDVGRINRSYRAPQKVGEDTIEVLNHAFRYKEMTKGAFDVTVRSIMEVWWKAQKENRLPTAEELAAAKATARLSSVKILLGNRVEIINPGTKVDLGGIATGFALDEAVKVLHKHGIKDFLIDAAGDMYASGRNCSRKPWTIAIRNPEDKSKIFDVVGVSDLSVSTSGDYERFYSIQGQKFSHIINPVTGYPQKGVVSATVIAPTAMDNDVLATALCILEPNEGIGLIDSLGKGYASIIMAKGSDGQLKIYKSKRYKDYQIGKTIKR